MKVRVAAVAALLLAGCVDGGGPEMKMVVDDHGVIGRYVSESEDAYVCSTQDDFSVPRSEARVEVWRASSGQGVLYMKDFGKVPVYAEPDFGSIVIGKMVYVEGYVPEVYPCLGYGDGWFLTEIGGLEGFVHEDFVTWDGMDTF